MNRDSVLNPNSKLSFNTKTYLIDPNSTYDGKISSVIGDKSVAENDTIYSSIEEGLILPEYRLPTETEWEYAALGLNELKELEMFIEERRNFLGRVNILDLKRKKH